MFFLTIVSPLRTSPSESVGGGEGRLYVPPFAGLQAIPTTPVVAQTFRGVPTKIAKTKIKNGLSATAARSARGEGVGRE